MGSIKSVSVSERVAISREVSYEGPEEFTANVLGAALGQHFGSAAVKNAPATGTVLGVSLGVLVARGFVTPRAQIKAYLAEENIDVAQIARIEFLNGLRADPRFATRLSEKGDAHFELEVYRYGLSQRSTFSSEYGVWLGIRAKLINPSGTVIWQDRTSVSGRDDAAPAVPYPAYFDDPATFRDSLATAARFLTQKMLRKM